MNSRKEIKNIVRNKYPEYKDDTVNITTGQIFRFRSIFEKGDQVITYDPETRNYRIVKIVSDYEYSETLLNEMKHICKVEWKEKLSRDELSPAARNTPGSIMAE